MEMPGYSNGGLCACRLFFLRTQYAIMACFTCIHEVKAQWQSGYAADCKSVYLGSTPGCASSFNIHSTPDSSGSNWHSGTVAQASPVQARWLQRPGALTAGLRQLGHVTLVVLDERAGTLPQDEAWLLDLIAQHPVWIREIMMSIGNVPSVVARSITPLDASTQQWAGMRSLQTRPLADMLYHDPHITRSPFRTSQLHAEQPLYQTVRHALPDTCPPAQTLLARSSTFWLNNQPLMVSECFLPGFWTLATQG